MCTAMHLSISICPRDVLSNRPSSHHVVPIVFSNSSTFLRLSASWNCRARTMLWCANKSRMPARNSAEKGGSATSATAVIKYRNKAWSIELAFSRTKSSTGNTKPDRIMYTIVSKMLHFSSTIFTFTNVQAGGPGQRDWYCRQHSSCGAGEDEMSYLDFKVSAQCGRQPQNLEYSHPLDTVSIYNAAEQFQETWHPSDQAVRIRK